MNIYLVAKRSKYQLERDRLGLGHEELLSKYDKEGINSKTILMSHRRQELSRDTICSALMVGHHTLDEYFAEDFSTNKPDLIVILGGDNAFTAVASRSGDIPVVGINSDPVTSVGCLTKWNSHRDTALAIRNGHYNVERWTRLESDRVEYPALSEIFLGETKRKDMSRHILEYRGEAYEQKCSGMLVATGAGSTGWYSSINWHRAPEGNHFPPTENRARFIITEMYGYSAKDMPLREGWLEANEELVIHSLNDSGGLVSADSWWEAPFTRGMTTRIKLSSPAQIIVPK